MAYRTMPPLRGLDDHETCAYLAGLLDGRGGRIRLEKITTREGYYHPLVVIYTSDDWLVEWLTSNIGGSATAPSRWGSMKWRVFGENAMTLIDAVRPHLKTRSRQAELVAMFRQMQADMAAAGGGLTAAEAKARRIIHQRIASLNSHGKVPWPTERLVIPKKRPALRSPLHRNVGLHLLAGWTNEQIAKRYRTHSAAVTVACREVTGRSPRDFRRDAGVPDGRATGVPDREIIHAYTNGATPTEIAREFGIHVATVLLALRRNDVPTRRSLSRAAS